MYIFPSKHWNITFAPAFSTFQGNFLQLSNHYSSSIFKSVMYKNIFQFTLITAEVASYKLCPWLNISTKFLNRVLELRYKKEDLLEENNRRRHQVSSPCFMLFNELLLLCFKLFQSVGYFFVGGYISISKYVGILFVHLKIKHIFLIVWNSDCLSYVIGGRLFMPF
jgi:hypothetical protein